jgi:gliding motility-associated-like protein
MARPQFLTRQFRYTLFTAFLLFVCTLASSQTPGLYINEVSQGASGNKEYVELLVVSQPTCTGITTLDLRGWIVDDNNGTHATGSGTGIAVGCIRFSQNAFWSAVPGGTLIVIYNDADVNVNLPANDISLTDGNCRLVIPADDCTLFEKNTSQPSTSQAAYPTTGYTACGNWNCLSMANSDDSFHTVTPAGNVFHAVSWGNNTLNNIIYFSGSSGTQVAYMTNATGNNINLQANWTRVTVTGNETPGAANNAANQQWISSMNNNCTPFTPLSLAVNTTNAGCTCAGSATAVATGGNGGYTYTWLPAVVGNVPTATALCPGSYTLTTTDAAGCSQTQIFTIAGSSVFTLSSTVNHVSCNGGSNGSATVFPTGGTPPFTYAWAPAGGNAPTANGLSAGTYTCTVTDLNGCNNFVTVTLTQPTALNITFAATQPGCNQSNGSLTATATGGNGTYAFQWTNGPANAAWNNLASGNYAVTVTDGAGCTATSSVTLTSVAGVAATLGNVTNASCNGSSDGSITALITGGQGPFTYVWSAPASSQTATASGLAAGSYTLTVTDGNGCTAQVLASVSQPLPVSVSLAANPQTVCAGSSTQLTALATGGNGGFGYSWLPVSGTGSSISVSPAANATYTVLATDANGCTGFNTIDIAVAPVPVVSFTADVQQGCAPLCVNFSDQSQVTSPATITAWNWNPGNATTASGANATVCYTTPGQYPVSLTVISSDGCTATLSNPAFIAVHAQPEAAFTTQPTQPTIADPLVFFQDVSTAAVAWNWNFGDAGNTTSNLQNPQFAYDAAVCYTVRLEVISAQGCVDDTLQEVCITPEISFYVPNTFTPNGDGKNDVFMPVGNGLENNNYELLIYDRWGNLLFESHNLSVGWDGRVEGNTEKVMTDTYVWKIQVQTATGRTITRIGHVNVIR